MQSGAGGGTPCTARQRSVLILLGANAGCMPSLQPLLLGALLDHHRITAPEIGQVAAAEAIGMAIAITLASSRVGAINPRFVVVLALSLMLAVNAATVMAEGAMVIALRALAGTGGGLLLWATMAMITRETNPTRTFALFLSLQAAYGFVLSTIFSHLLIPRFGPSGAYWGLALLNLAMLATLSIIPRIDMAPNSTGKSLPPFPGLVALVGCAFFICGVMAFWIYVIPIVREGSRSGVRVETIIPFVIGIHILGGIAAAVSSRITASMACVGGPLVMIGCIVAILWTDMILIQYALLLLFAFIWMFVPPFQLPLLLGIDPTARTAMFISSSHLAGIAAGPFLASFAVLPESAMGALKVAIACLGMASLIPLVARQLSMRTSERV